MSASEDRVRDVSGDDFSDLLRLNLESEHFLSPLDAARLRHLHDQSSYHRLVVDDNDSEVLAFLLVFSAGADYDSPNYLWFDARYDNFLYVDRIVVDMRHQSRRLGSRLYTDLFEFARGGGFQAIVCEYDVEPPNEASQRFHNRFGFSEVGRQSVQNGKKQVSLQLAPVNESA